MHYVSRSSRVTVICHFGFFSLKSSNLSSPPHCGKAKGLLQHWQHSSSKCWGPSLVYFFSESTHGSVPEFLLTFFIEEKQPRDSQGVLGIAAGQNSPQCTGELDFWLQLWQLAIRLLCISWRSKLRLPCTVIFDSWTSHPDVKEKTSGYQSAYKDIRWTCIWS